jgi:capsule polysaccharide export protein KpsE/RkpR
MSSRPSERFSTRTRTRIGDRARQWLASVSVPRYTTYVTLIACTMAVLYWSLMASDRFVSEARIVMPRTEVSGAPSLDIGSLLTSSVGGGRSEQLLLRDYLLSADMLNRLDKALDLRGHFSDKRRDILSRMWSKDVPQEWFYGHLLSRVSVDYDDYAGVLVIRVQAYDPKMAHAIAAMLVDEAERYALIQDLKARRNLLLRYLSPAAPAIADLDFQIAATEKRIAEERKRPAAPGGVVPIKLSVYQAATLPEYPLEPRRIYNILIFVLVALVIAGIVRLLAAIVREHKD